MEKDVPISAADVERAYGRIRPYVRRTPVFAVPGATLGHDAPISLKLEYLQFAGSFKPRGAFNTMLCQPIGAAGVAAASGGNHGVAVAYAAKVIGVAAHVFVPRI